MVRSIAEETQQLETDLNEERSRYQNLLSEHLRLEEKYDDLKEALSSVRDRHTKACVKKLLHLILLMKFKYWFLNETKNKFFDIETVF